MLRTFFAFVLILALPAQAEVDFATKMQLQADMQRHIDGQLIGNTYPSIDLITGEVRQYYPASGHPMILKMTGSDLFVLCSEFRDTAGNNHNVDFYLKPDGAGYKVIRTEIANRAPLKTMMQNGLVAKVD